MADRQADSNHFFYITRIYACRDLYIARRGSMGVVSWEPAFEGERDELFVCSDPPDFQDSPQHLPFDLEHVNGYAGLMGRAYLRDFAEAVIHDRAPAISGKDGIAALKVVEAMTAPYTTALRFAGFGTRLHVVPAERADRLTCDGHRAWFAAHAAAGDLLFPSQS